MVSRRERTSREKRSTLLNVKMTMWEAAGNLVIVKFIAETLSNKTDKKEAA